MLCRTNDRMALCVLSSAVVLIATTNTALSEAPGSAQPSATSDIYLEALPRDVAAHHREALAAREAALDENAQPDGEPARVSILVHFDPALNRDAVKRQNVKAFARNLGGKVRYEYKLLPDVINLRDIPAERVAEIENLPGVVRIEKDQFHPNLVRLHDSTPLINGLQSQIAAAGHSADGAGVRVAVCDTGIDTDHVMYADRIDSAAGRDFYNDDNNPEDDNGHGTHVAGIAVGAAGLSVDFGCGAGSQPFQGVAPEATLIGVKILNSGGGGFDSDIIAGIDYAADQSPSGGRADVINLSIGTGNFTSGACTHSWAVAANNAVANGVVVVAASGNENRTNSMGSPACGADVIAVGATWKTDYPSCEDNQSNWNWGVCTDFSPQQDDIVCFSNESDFLDVSAPGANIWSASNAAGGGSIVGNSGTSMASPKVAGLAALILSADPSLTPAEVRQIIRDGAIDLGPTGFDRAYGWGRIDVINSLDLVTGGGCSSDGECDDGLFCNGAETCVAGSCQSGSPPDCSDGVACTDDSCNESTDSCDNVANDGNCDNGLFCDGAETCDAFSGCISGAAPDCNDGIACTNDSCNESTDSCNNTPDDGNCDDGQFCNGAEVCVAGVGCTGGSDPCPGQFCNESTDECEDCQDDLDCDDGQFCNGAEVCVGGTCQSGSPPDCNDGVACTDDSCNESTDSCDNVANDGNCDNGLFCDGSETCDPFAGCQSGTAPNCNDGIACTNDSCNESTDSCDNTPDDGNCDDGQFCNGAETCVAGVGCAAGSDPCPGQFCDEAGDDCDECLDDLDCDDGQFCNGAESCANGSCQPGNDPCPGQGCDEGTDTCGGCGVDADCDDGSACTTDTCNSGVCSNTCAAQVSSYPDFEDFESGFGDWANVGGDQFNWTRDRGGTPSSNTGPSGDHTTGSGWYLYIEGSSPRQPGDTAILEGPCVDLTGSTDGVMSFWYHMYGSSIGSLAVEATTDCQNWSTVWSLSGNQGNSWLPADVDLSAYSGEIVTLRFVGVRGGSWPSDIAIDDISIDAASAIPCSTDGECDDGDACTVDACVASLCQNTPLDCDDGNACTDDACVGGVCVNSCADEIASYPYDEDFESGQGIWTNLAGDDFDWTRDAGGTPSSGTGPSGDHTTGSGWYMYIETSSPRVSGDTAILEAGCFDLSGASDAELSFWYHMYGSSIGSLSVEASSDCDTWSTLWSLSGNQGNSWSPATVDLSGFAGGNVTLRFVGVRGSSWSGDIAIDDINVDVTAANCTFDSDCDDGLYCNGAEFCSGSICQAGTPPNCDDGIACTSDSCNESTDSCDHNENDASCNDGQFCNGVETCDAGFGCVGGSDPCPGQFCDEGSDSCVDCLVDGDCDDGLFCNGEEICNGGTCEAAPTGGVANGTFDGSADWSDNIPVAGSISYPGNLNVTGPNNNSAGFTWSSQSGVTVNGANLEFDLLSYTSSDIGQWDYPVFYLNGTFYGLNSNGTLGAPTTGGNSGAGTIDNGSQTSSTIHFTVDIDGLAGHTGPHTIGFGVQSSDGAFGAGTAVFDDVTPALGGGSPCAPGETCDEANDVCVP